MLADWAKETQLSILQILPINDTTANYSWSDSYPYAAISVYALHPQYLSISQLEYSLPRDLVEEYNSQKDELNAFKQSRYSDQVFDLSSSS